MAALARLLELEQAEEVLSEITFALRLKPWRGPHVGGPDWTEPSDGGVFDLFTFASVISA